MLAIITITPILPWEVNPWYGSWALSQGSLKYHGNAQAAYPKVLVIWGNCQCCLF